jgi:hypothetical protein
LVFLKVANALIAGEVSTEKAVPYEEKDVVVY